MFLDLDPDPANPCFDRERSGIGIETYHGVYYHSGFHHDFLGESTYPSMNSKGQIALRKNLGVLRRNFPSARGWREHRGVYIEETDDQRVSALESCRNPRAVTVAESLSRAGTAQRVLAQVMQLLDAMFL